MKFSALILVLAACVSAPAVAFDRDALFDEADRAYEAKAYETALSKMEALAVFGDARAQNYAGYMHAFAKGTLKDLTKATRWYCHAALQGNPKALFNLGRMLVDQEDVKSANVWYAQAAQIGDPAAQINLGMNHLDGEGTGENPALAYRWLAVGLRDAKGPKGLAHTYLADAEAALSPAELHSENQWVQAWQPHPFTDKDGTVLAKTKPCAGLDMDLQPLTFNKGSEALRQGEHDLAYALFKILADADQAPSQLILAEMFDKGQGLEKDAAQATAWYCRAAQLGDREAMWRLASRSDDETDFFHELGATLGDTRAQMALGRKMMETDLVQAYKWLSVASNENLDESGEAEKLFEQIRTQVTREQKIEAITLAADFWPVQFNPEMAKAVGNTSICRGG